MNTPLVAIIGLPNAGKSTFFNKVLGQKKALIYPEAGTTRDRHYGLTEWDGWSFYLIDTAGIINRPNAPLEKDIQKQTDIALDEADLILFLIDGKSELSDKLLTAASKLKHSRRPVLIALNKIDTRNQKSENSLITFRKLGLGKAHPVSSINGSGMGDFLDAVVLKLKEKFPAREKDETARLKLAFLGKPNVGKSSLINALLKEDRLIVSATPGTTRSTVDIPFTYKDREYLLLDTAGIKRRWKTDTDVETAAAMQALRTMAHVDVALFVLDASQKITVQDQTIAQKIVEENKSLVILLNKSDLINEKDQQKILDILPDYFPMLWWAPVVFTSSKTGKGLDLVLQFACEVFDQTKREIAQEELDSFLDEVLEKHFPGKMDDQRAPKIYNLKQIGVTPPQFKILVNFPAAVAPAWKKHLEKQLRLKFDLRGTPIIINYVRRN